MQQLVVYIPMDRRHALVYGQSLVTRTQGAALFADISGFTPLTEALVQELGPQRGAEELTRYLNQVYDEVIDALHQFGGSVIAFAGDAITCWLDGDDGRRATASAIAMQMAMQQVGTVQTPGGNSITLAMKASVASGPARRFLVGDPAIRVIDALAGATLVRLANGEHQARRNEVVVDEATAQALGTAIHIAEWREHTPSGQRFAVVKALTASTEVLLNRAWPPLQMDAIAETHIRPWLLPAVYERLRHGLGDFLAELRPTVALFVRFSGIDYDHDDDAGVKLDAYVRWVQSLVARYEGTLIDLNIGDKGSYLYINFGAPIAHEDSADRAAALALALHNNVPATLNFIDEVRIGISQGRMRAGAYGGANHRTYGVLGDEVNMAARLMIAAKPWQILISAAARQSLRKGFAVTELPPIQVKGKTEPVSVFSVTGLQYAHAFQLTAQTYALPMIGREAELALALSKLSLVHQGRGQVIGIHAEAGLGKSRLAAELLKQAIEQGCAYYGGECESYGLNSSYLVWQPVWRRIFGIDAGWSLARQQSALEGKLRSINPDLLPRLPLLGTLFNIDIPDNGLTQSLDGKLRKSLLESLLLDCLHVAAQQAPMVIVLEACQWLDPLSHDLIEQVARAIAAWPVLLVLTYRPKEDLRLRDGHIGRLPYYSEITLAPLSIAAAVEFVQAKLRQMLGTAAQTTDGVPTALSASLIERLSKQAEGNPFYIEELINYLHVRRVDFSDPTALDRVEMPDSLQRLVLTMIDQLSENQKITVKVASVLGRIFRVAWLLGAYAELGDVSKVQADLELLRQQELLVLDNSEPELVYLFRQVITQGVTYESLPVSVKSILHDQFGQFIEQMYADKLEKHLDLLAYHYDRSPNLNKRREYLLKAGEAAQASYANLIAIDYFERLLPLLDAQQRGAVLLKAGQVMDTVGDYERAMARITEALALAEAEDNVLLQAQCQIAIGELHRKQSHYDAAASCFAQAQAQSEHVGDAAGVAKALVCAGSLALYQGHYDAAQTAYARSLALRRQLDDQPNIANVLNNIAIAAANQGDLAQAQTLFAESLAIRRQLGNKWGVATSLSNLGELALRQEALVQAQAYLEEAVASLRLIGDKWMLGNSLVNLANALRGQAEYDAAYPLYLESLRINRDLGDRWMLCYGLENIGGLWSLQGQAMRALRLVGAAAGIRDVLNTPLAPDEQTQLDRILQPAREALDPAAAEAAFAAGRALSLEQAIAEAQRPTS